MNIMERFERVGVIPVVVMESAKQAVSTAQALLDGGIDVMEITMRTAAGEDAIREISQNCPDTLVGAGTVVTLDQCKACVGAGAKFIVSPGFSEEIIAWCIEHDIFVLPGCVTPTELMTGMKMGLSLFKFFPANVYGGLDALKALSAPFGTLRFVPTGGINADNLKEYLGMSCIAAVGGSWVCSKEDIKGENYQKITALSKQASDIVNGR